MLVPAEISSLQVFPYIGRGATWRSRGGLIAACPSKGHSAQSSWYVICVVSGVRRPSGRGIREMPDCRRIPDTTTWTKPPYFGRTIALWGLYSAFILGRSSGNGPESVGNTPLCYRRVRCGAIVLTKQTVALGTAAKRLSPRRV